MTDAAVPRLSARVSAASPLASPSVGSPATGPSAARPRRRVAVAAALAATAALLLSACGNSRPGTAAVVGDQRISDSDLQTLVDESLNAPGVRAALPNSEYRGDLGAYRRTVLNLEVERLLAEDAVRKLGITVDENAVDAQYKAMETQAGGATSFASSLASQLAVSPALYRRLVRTKVVESEIGYAQGSVERPTDAQLRAFYEQNLPALSSATLSVIQLPSQAVADQVAAQLQRNPSQFAAVAARYAAASGSQSSSDPRTITLNQLPQDLVAKLQETPKDAIFPYAAAGSGNTTYLVIRFGGIDTPTLEEARPQLENQTLQQAAAAGVKYLRGLASDVGVDVNPRYGTWKQDQLSITDFVNPVIKPTPTPAATSGGTVPGDGTTGNGSGGDQPTPTPSG